MSRPQMVRARDVARLIHSPIPNSEQCLVSRIVVSFRCTSGIACCKTQRECRVRCTGTRTQNSIDAGTFPGFFLEGPDVSEVTLLLERINGGDSAAFDLLLPLVYQELRGRAAICFSGQIDGHTLQPTALVHEAFLRLAGSESPWENRRHFYNAASEVMRQILVSHYRAKTAQKRGGAARRVDLESLGAPDADDSTDWVAVDSALQALRQTDHRRYQVVMLKFFSGLTDAEVAQSLSVSEKTVERDWAIARVYLRALIEEHPE
jgi:RNA polymerase sigma factor (TIGR02999 family)